MEQLEANKEININLKEIVGVLLRKAWIIVLAGVLLAAVAYFVSTYSITPMYQSTTKIYVMSKQDSSTSVTYSDLQTSSQLTNDYMTLITSRPVTEKVIQELGLDMKHNELVDMITVNNPSNTRVLNITVEYSDPYLAKEIADAVREASSIHISNVMDIKEVNIVEEANLPEDPISPSVKRNTVLGGILGVLIAGAIILVITMLDDTIKTPEDIERYLGVSVLSSIPIQKHLNNMKDKETKPKKISKKNKATT
jgi:capsular polysaccharide biosynthesis protein